jgi:hypothetical protein
VIKSSKVRWVGHVAPTGEKRNEYKVLVKKIGRENLGVGGRLILKSEESEITWKT